MGHLIYSAITSLDGFIEDADGGFAWAEPDAEVHASINDLEASTGTHLFGRRMYETMAVWETMGGDADASPEEAAFVELWRGLDKVVYSTTLEEVWTARTRLERTFDPAAVRHLVDSADHDVSVSGPGLAQHAFRAGLVDEVHQFLCPIVIGGGKPAWPSDVRLDLELVDQRRFGNGVVHLHHRVRRGT